MNPYGMPTIAPYLAQMYGQAPQNPYLQNLQIPQVNLRGQRMRAPEMERPQQQLPQVPMPGSYDPNERVKNAFGMEMSRGTMDALSDFGAGIGQAYDNPFVQALSYADRSRRARMGGDPEAQQRQFENSLKLREADRLDREANADPWQVGEMYDENGRAQKGIFKASDPLGTWQNWGGTKGKDVGTPVKIMGRDGPVWSTAEDAIGQRAYVDPPNTVVNNIDNGESAFTKEFGKNQATNFNDLVTRAQSAPQTVSRINEFRNLMANGTPTGKVQEMTLPARQFFNSIGITNDQAIPNQEALQSIAANFVLDQFSKLKGPQTDKDAVLVAGSVAQLSKTPEGNSLILDLAERAANYDVELAKAASDYVAANGDLDAGWIRYQSQWAQQNPLLTPELRNRIQTVKQGKPQASTTTSPDVIYRGSRPK